MSDTRRRTTQKRTHNVELLSDSIRLIRTTKVGESDSRESFFDTKMAGADRSESAGHTIRVGTTLVVVKIARWNNTVARFVFDIETLTNPQDGSYGESFLKYLQRPGVNSIAHFEVVDTNDVLS